VAALAGDWLASRTDIRAKSVRGYEFALLAPLKRLGQRPVQAVTHDEIATLVRCLGEQGGVNGGPLSRRSVEYSVTSLRQVFDLAVTHKLRPDNPVERVRLPRTSRAERAKRNALVPWTAGEYRQFTNHVDLFEPDPTMRAAFRLSLCGLRRGEVLGLDWNHVRFDQGIVHVEASRVTLGAGVTVTDDAKSTASERLIPVDIASPGTMATLRAAYDHQTAYLGYEPAGEDLVVVTKSQRPYERHLSARPLHPDTYSKRFRKSCQAAGVRVIHLHAIRHTWASIWLAAGGSIPDGAAFLGHTVPVFLSTYVRTTNKSMEDTLRDVAARMWTAGDEVA
jgi:integrase